MFLQGFGLGCHGGVEAVVKQVEQELEAEMKALLQNITQLQDLTPVA